MCGIVGYIGRSQAVPILLDGLKRLSYRGYDSAGIAVLSPEDRLVVRKTAGKLAALKAHLSANSPEGSVGIGHTRWATHGKASDLNAHPHTDEQGRIAVVHNGIIENHRELRRQLQEKGCVFTSETDTEAVVHLLSSLYDGDMCRTLGKVLPMLRGSFALAVLCVQEPGKLFCARRGSPLVIGLQNGEGFLASDLPALLSHTRDVVFLEDGEVAVLDGAGLSVCNEKGDRHTPSFHHVQWTGAEAEKEGYSHFMRKEIYEQPLALQRTLDAWRCPIHADEARAMKKLTIVACGSAYHAGVLGKYAIEKLARLPVEVEIASEYRYRFPLTITGEWMIAVSQSGETADTLAAAEVGRQRGAHVMALCNAEGSSLVRLVGSERTILTHAGPEMAVASTKAFLTQSQTLMLLAMELGKARGTLDEAEADKLSAAIRRLPELAKEAAETEKQMQKIASVLKHSSQLFFIGRGMDYALAMEAALKTKEICYIPSEAFAAGELKHGPIALLQPGQTVIAALTQPDLLEKSLSNLQEAVSRGAKPLIICTRSLAERAGEAAADRIIIPDAGAVFSPLLAIIPLQLLAYHMAVERGCDVDQPRNLAKSVTVE